MVQGLNGDFLGWVGTGSLDLWQSEYLNGKNFRRKFIDNISSEYREKHIKFGVILGFRTKLR